MKTANLIMATAVLYILTCPVAADEAELLTDIIEAHRSIDMEFADMHCQWDAIITKGGDNREVSLEFWSKEGLYYRLDTTERPGSADEGTFTERLIIRPDEYALIHASNPDDLGAIVDFGTSDDGFDMLAGNFFFDSATRHSGIFPVQEALTHCLNHDEDWSMSSASRRPESYNLAWEWSDGKSRTKVQVDLDLVSFRCLRSSIRNFPSGKVGLKIDTKKTYDSNPVVPLTHHETWTDNDGYVDTWHFERTECSFESPPINVFEIPSFASSHSMLFWGRRIIVIMIGVVLIGVYFWGRGAKR